MSERYILEIQEDPATKDLILEFPDSLMESAGWKIGDTIEWIDNNDGSWTLKKKEQNEIYTYC